jgi:diguanylate cyclase (GGDEF)-like protein
MGFRFRLASFFVAALIAVQALTAVLVYEVTRHELIGEGQRQLGMAAGAFARQLDDISERVASSVQVLSLDYALRAAIAQRDEATLLSALRNHGRRVGATQMLVLDVDGRVEADSSNAYADGAVFRIPILSRRHWKNPRPPSWRGTAARTGWWWFRCSRPTSWAISPRRFPLTTRGWCNFNGNRRCPAASNWRRRQHMAGASSRAGPVRRLNSPRALLRATHACPNGPRSPTWAGANSWRRRSGWTIRAAVQPVVAVLGYSVDEALRPYRRVASAWAGLLALGLVVGLVGALLIARGVSRPVEQLAESARRIQAGDYTPPPSIDRADEIGQLSAAFANMAQSIREREAHILYQAGHDQVTGLPNRVAASTAIQRDLAARPSRHAAVLMIGLGRMPEIIKTMGHAICDRLMHDAARRLQAPAQGALVARATDTEFLVFLPDVSKSDAIAAAFRSIEALAEPYREAGLTLDLAPAVGIALSPLHGVEASDLMRHAGVALIGHLVRRIRCRSTIRRPIRTGPSGCR